MIFCNDADQKESNIYITTFHQRLRSFVGQCRKYILLKSIYASSQVFGHSSTIDGVDASFLHNVAESSQLRVVIKSCSVVEAFGPGENTCHRVCAGWSAFLVFAVMTSDSSVGRFSLNGLAIGTH